MVVHMTAGKECHKVLESAWVNEPGYTCPNPDKYPWQWLWDSCFHAIAWSAFADVRAVRELESLFSGLTERGFLPNCLYHNKPWANWWMWFTKGHSTITQPPMYGHALRVLHERRLDVDHLLDPAGRALHYLIDSRLDPATGLVKVVHPWETGCDDSPRWSNWMRFGYRRKLWNLKKYFLVRSMRVVEGGAVSNRKFEVCSASFNALVAFNAIELAKLTGDTALLNKGRAIARSLESTWQADLATWADVAPGSGKVTSSIPTLESFLPVLVVEDEKQVNDAFANLMNPDTFRRACGFAGTIITDPSYRSDGYWRGGCWPQLVYLLWLAAGKRDCARQIRDLCLSWLASSHLAEFWDPESGRGLGAIPQSWTAVLIELVHDKEQDSDRKKDL